MTRRCAWCDVTFAVRHSPKGGGPMRTHRFCSRDCCEALRAERRRPHPRTRHCFQCGVDFVQPAKGRPALTCSAKCARARRRWRDAQDLPIDAPIRRKEAA